MGNWRTVHIVGTCDETDVPALRKAITLTPGFERFHCLLGGLGLMALPIWAESKIDAIGNVAERDYEPEDVRKELEALSVVAPSLAVKVHCGADYEDQKCIATVTLAAGKASVGEPEVEAVGEVPASQVLMHYAQIRNQQRWGH